MFNENQTFGGQIKSTWILLHLGYLKELFILNKLAIPNALTFVIWNLAIVVSVIFTGHISKEQKYLDGSSVALSFANVTGNAVTIGLRYCLGDALFSRPLGPSSTGNQGYISRDPFSSTR